MLWQGFWVPMGDQECNAPVAVLIPNPYALAILPNASIHKCNPRIPATAFHRRASRRHTRPFAPGASTHCTLMRLVLLYCSVLCTTYHVQCTSYHVSCNVHYLICTMYHVTCTMYHAFCTMYCVQCTMYVLWTMYHVLFPISYVSSIGFRVKGT